MREINHNARLKGVNQKFEPRQSETFVRGRTKVFKKAESVRKRFLPLSSPPPYLLSPLFSLLIVVLRAIYKIDSNEVGLAPESTISSPGADSIDLQITLPKEQKTEAKLQLHRECCICCVNPLDTNHTYVCGKYRSCFYDLPLV